MDFITRSDELKRQFRLNWIMQLSLDHEWKISKLNFGTKLPPVTIDIFDSATLWGQWKPEIRVILMNSRLILGYPWDVTLGIFYHEIAHQVVSDLYPARAANEPTHGPTFQHICDLLQLQPLYRHSNVDLDNGKPLPSHLGPKTQSNENNPLIVKIKKLLALSGSPEPHEAEAALTKASELMARHNIDSMTLMADADDYEIWRIDLNTKRTDRKSYLISVILQEHFFVHAIFNNLYDPRLCCYLKSVDLIGRPVNLSMAKHVFYYLSERVESLWEAHKPLAAFAGEKGLGAKTAFISNLLIGLRKKLLKAEAERQKEASHAHDGNGPAKNFTPSDYLASDPKFKDFLKENFPTLHTSKGQTSRAYAPFSSSAGKKAGEELDIYKPIAEGNRKSGFVEGYIGKD
ncbi:MAG: DUF2786 domain-containing protein [Deltaproteobacteria bacterium]|nr:DUF2786 domain-containing protein [Deltaproteobacteria bacterium]